MSVACATEGEAAIVLDAHAHVHRVCDTGLVLAAAARNLRSAAGGAPVRLGVALARAAGQPSIDAVAAEAVRCGWSCERSPGCVRLRGAEVLWVFDARQVVTSEGVEVLAIGAECESVPERVGLDETIGAACDAGMVPMLAWGFGKWWGRRGRVVLDAIGRAEVGRLALCDQAGRPRGLREHAAFAAARSRGVAVLAGSDPLAIGAHVAQAGVYATRVQGAFDEAEPGPSLARLLREGHVEVVGRRRSVGRALSDQVWLRVGARGRR